jgi:hypothetical protein
MRNMIRSLVVGFGLMLQCQSDAAVSYEFNDGLLSPTTVAQNSTATPISFPTGWSGSGGTTGGRSTGGPGGYFFIHKNHPPNSFSSSDYVSFTVTAASEYLLNLNGGLLSFDARLGGSGGVNWAVSSSVLGYGTLLDQGSVTTSTWTTTTIGFNNINYDGQESVEFRIYVWGPSSTKQDLHFDNIKLVGVTVVPEPMHLALGVFGLIFVGARARKYFLARGERS